MANALREEVAAAERRLEEERSSHASARHRSVASPCFHQDPHLAAHSCWMHVYITLPCSVHLMVSRCRHIYTSD